jgi:RHS repeat-associated protein
LVNLYYNDKGFRVRKESYTTRNLANTQYYVRDVAVTVMAIYNEPSESTSAELVEVPIYGVSRLGIYYKNVKTNYELTEHLGNVRAVVTKSNATPSLFADYYPGEDGALRKCPVDIFSERASLSRWRMPNRNVTGDYRYGYQGQFAETDPETGKPAFQLRLYDPRINRWLTTDPYNQYHSPYVGMGNDWVNSIDPDGGYKTWFGALGGWIAGGFQGKINHRGHGGDLEYAVTRSIKNDNWKGGDDPLFTLKNDYGTTKVLNIFRDTQTNLSTTSTFTFGGVNGFILEPAGPDTTTPNLDRRIPEGVYNLEAYSSKKYPSNFRLYNSQVSKTRKILLHKGNYPKNTEGCLLPGCSRTTDAVWTSGGSRGKFTELRNAINAVDVENVIILIHNDFH